MKVESHNNNATHHCFVPIINVKQIDTFFETIFGKLSLFILVKLSKLNLVEEGISEH